MGEKQIPACFSEMTVEQMRREFGYDKFGKPGTESHSFALFWLSIKESEERDKREASTLSIAKEANLIARTQARWTRYAMIAAATAVMIAAIAAREDMMWLISWVINFIKTS
jgi:hypothetical protein